MELKLGVKSEQNTKRVNWRPNVAVILGGGLTYLNRGKMVGRLLYKSAVRMRM